MTEAQSIALITGTLAAVPGTLATIIGYLNHRGIRTNSTQILQTKEDIDMVGRQIDGRMDEHIALTKQISHAAGVAQEKKDVQKRKDVKAQARVTKP
jgi:hypothetical protein